MRNFVLRALYNRQSQGVRILLSYARVRSFYRRVVFSYFGLTWADRRAVNPSLMLCNDLSIFLRAHPPSFNHIFYHYCLKCRKSPFFLPIQLLLFLRANRQEQTIIIIIFYRCIIVKLWERLATNSCCYYLYFACACESFI